MGAGIGQSVRPTKMVTSGNSGQFPPPPCLHPVTPWFGKGRGGWNRRKRSVSDCLTQIKLSQCWKVGCASTLRSSLGIKGYPEWPFWHNTGAFKAHWLLILSSGSAGKSWFSSPDGEIYWSSSWLGRYTKLKLKCLKMELGLWSW